MICRGRHTVTIYRLGRDRSLDTDARAVLRCTAAQVPAFTTSMLEAAVSPEGTPCRQPFSPYARTSAPLAPAGQSAALGAIGRAAARRLAGAVVATVPRRHARRRLQNLLRLSPS